MGLIITSIILSILTVIGVYVICKCLEKNKKWSLLGLIWLIIIVFGCFTNIGANTVGIMYNPFKGGIQDNVLGEGFRTKTPFDKVYKISTEIQEFTFENLTVQTNDSQWINSIIQVQVRIDKDQAFEYFKKYGGKSLKDIQNILSNTTQKQLEKISTQYNIMEVLGEKRDEIVNKTLEEVKIELQKDGIIVERLILVDTDAGDAIEQSIQKEASAKKEAETAKYLKEKAELEGEAKITEAQKNGEAKIIEAQKEKEANELKQKTLTPEILTEKMIEKWNGTLPTTMLGEDISTVFDINK